MREFLTPDSDVDTLRFLTSSSSNLVVGLEGEDDWKLLHGWVSSKITFYLSSAGKEGLLKAAHDAHTMDSLHAIFVVDRDFDDFLESAPLHPHNVISTHHHDCFVDIVFESPETLVRAVESKLKSSSSAMSDHSLDTFSRASDIVASAIRLAKHKAVVRAVAARRSIGLDFKTYSFFKQPTSEVTSEAIYEALSSRYQGRKTLPSNTSELISLATTELDSLDYSPVGDHDLIEAVRAILKEQFKICLSEEAFRNLIILTFTVSHFSKAHWCAHIASWAKQFDVDLFVEQKAPSYLSTLIPSTTQLVQSF